MKSQKSKVKSQKFLPNNDERIPIVLLGEKDHGKSTLLGRLLCETGSMPQDRLRGVRQAARKLGKKFEWSHLLDSFRYEREHEMTLDTTRANVKIAKRWYEFIDVPGHRELIKNMITGASEARRAVLLIDATCGIRRQTLRHIRIAEFLGISDLIVAVNKLDLSPNPKFVFDRIKLEIESVLSRMKFYHWIVLPISALYAYNILPKSKRFKWFHGPTLAGAFAKKIKSPVNPVRTGASRMSDGSIKSLLVASDFTVDWSRRRSNGVKKITPAGLVYAVQSFYPPDIVSGKVISGPVKTGKKVVCLGSVQKYRIQKVLSGGEIQLKPAPTHLGRGDILSEVKTQILQKFQAKCIFLEKPRTKNISIEGDFREGPARITSGPAILQEAAAVKFYFKRGLISGSKFVVKDNDRIIALCQFGGN